MSSSEWKKYKLGDLVKFQRGHDLSKSEFIAGNIPIAGSNGIIGYHNKFTCKAPCITIGRSGNLGTPHFYNKNIWAHNTTLFIKEFYNSDPRFIYYLLQTLDLKQFNSGSAVPSLNRNYIHPIEVTAPNFETQTRIASILSSLDDKIELNRQTNKTLESIAQTLFKEMCLPKGEELPEGWRVGTLVEVVDINMGQSPAGTSYNQVGEGIIFFQGKAEFGFRFPAIDKYTTEPKKYANKFDSLLSVRAPVGTINMATEKCCIGRGLAAISGKNNCWSFAFYLLKSLSVRFEMYNGEGTVFGSINKSDLESIEIVIPPKDIIEDFNAIGRSIDEFVYINEQETQTLAAIRDSLLPKLMKGEIEI